MESEEEKKKDEKVASLERFLCEMIVTHGQREKTLLEQIAALRSDIENRSLGFQQTLAHYQTRLRSNKIGSLNDLCDSDSGVGEDHLGNVHLAVILSRTNGSLGFNVSGGGGGENCISGSSPLTSSQPTLSAKELVICKVNPDGPAHGKLCLQDRILKVNGIDLSSSGHDEAVDLIKTAQEPLVVEIVRQMSAPWLRFNDAASQTELTLLRSKEDLSQEEMSEFSHDLKKYDIEYEEIMLSKETVETKLGLTICYTQEAESSTDIFIEMVDPDGVAGRDGRMKRGDQVVRVNGVDVHDRKQAEELFESRCSNVSLVVARPRLKNESLILVEKDDKDDGEMDAFGHYHNCNRLPQSILEEEGLDFEEDYEEEIAAATGDLNENKGAVCDQDKRVNIEVSSVQKCDLEKTVELECEKGDKESVAKVADAVDRLDLNEEIDTKSDVGSLNKSRAIELWVKSTAVKEDIRHRVSASELCRGISLPPPPDDTDLPSVGCDCCRDCDDQSFVMPGTSCGSITTLYTNRHNLDHTIQLQQQLFQQALLASSSSSSSGRSPSSASTKNPSTLMEVPSGRSSATMEWKVKKRADGSRYIVRRPVRSKLLKERASKLAEERCGLTTDDDAASEMKAGRYWNKEERKRHLERAKEHRHRKEELLRSLDAGKTSSDKGILELSRRKMTRYRGKNLFDDFTTVQEVLAHGSHVRTDGKVPHRLLSVTTV